MTRVLVTGATGFVGAAVVPWLSQSGFEVVAAVRRTPEPSFGDDVRVSFVGDVGPNTNWEAPLAGIDAIVHLAARAHVMDEKEKGATSAYHRTNTEATHQLATQAAVCGVKRLVFVSTIKVNGDRTTHSPFSETDEPSPTAAYAISKAEAERALRGVAERTGLEVVILRAPLVYGEGVKGNFRSLLRLCTTGVPLPLGGASNRRSMVYVGNLADAIRSCLSHERAANELFLVRDGDDVSIANLVRRLRAGLEVPQRMFSFPLSMLRLGARAAGQADKLARLIDALVVDDTKLRTMLGWSPPFTIEAGLRRTVEWHRSKSRS